MNPFPEREGYTKRKEGQTTFLECLLLALS